MTTAATASVPLQVVRGGFWERSLAYVIDGALLTLVSFIIAVIVRDQNASTATDFIIDLGYFSYFWSSLGGGQTPGMRVFRLRIVRVDGTPLSVVGALLRFVGLIISVIALGIGVFWVAFDANKQGWHDKIASTFVLMDEPGPYPVQVTFADAEGGRFWSIPVLGIVARLVLLLPHYFVLYSVGILVFAAQLVIWVWVLFGSGYPAWARRLVGGYLRWSTRVNAYFLGLTDRYPTPYHKEA